MSKKEVYIVLCTMLPVIAIVYAISLMLKVETTTAIPPPFVEPVVSVQMGPPPTGILRNGKLPGFRYFFVIEVVDERTAYVGSAVQRWHMVGHRQVFEMEEGGRYLLQTDTGGMYSGQRLRPEALEVLGTLPYVDSRGRRLTLPVLCTLDGNSSPIEGNGR